MTVCPKCGTDNDENYNFCESCGEKLKLPYKFCPHCGDKNSENAKFCINCGMSLEKSESKDEPLKGLNGENNKSHNKTISLGLTPAETLVIMNHKLYHGMGTSPKELLKTTFIDLIFKNVFKIDVREKEKKGIFGTKIVKKTYLLEGKNFNMPLKPHEEVFRDYLPDKADSKRLKKLQMSVFKAFKQNYAEKKLLGPLVSEGYFDVKKKFLGKKYSLTDKGEEARDLILQLKAEGQDLDNWIDSDPEKARAYIMMGGSNIFLTDDYYFDWFKNNSKKIAALFTGAAVIGTAYAFNRVRWYSAFRHHGGIDFDDFDDFNSFDDGDFGDIFTDFDFVDAFDSMDSFDFDSGFDGGFDGGGFDGGDGGGGGD
ncbi:MAG: zinc-ribbon domain-containing protein [Methanobacterium sp.]